jgi:hypothetical protein
MKYEISSRILYYTNGVFNMMNLGLGTISKHICHATSLIYNAKRYS